MFACLYLHLMVFCTVYFNSFLKSFVAFVVKSFRLFNLHLLLGRSPNLEGSEKISS